MPVMDGLTALKRIMAEAPTAVIMVSVTTQEGRARDHRGAGGRGAGRGEQGIGRHPGRGRRKAARAAPEGPDGTRRAAEDRPDSGVGPNRFRLLREESLRARPATGPLRERARPERDRDCGINRGTRRAAVHHPATSGRPQCRDAGRAAHLSRFHPRPGRAAGRLSELRVREAEDGDPILPGLALIAPAGIHMVARRKAGRLVVGLQKEPAGHAALPGGRCPVPLAGRAAPASRPAGRVDRYGRRRRPGTAGHPRGRRMDDRPGRGERHHLRHAAPGGGAWRRLHFCCPRPDAPGDPPRLWQDPVHRFPHSGLACCSSPDLPAGSFRF